MKLSLVPTNKYGLINDRLLR